MSVLRSLGVQKLQTSSFELDPKRFCRFNSDFTDLIQRLCHLPTECGVMTRVELADKMY